MEQLLSSPIDGAVYVNRQPPPSASLGGGCKLVSLFLEAMTDVKLALMSQPLPSLTDTITIKSKSLVLTAPGRSSVARVALATALEILLWRVSHRTENTANN